MYRRRGEPKRPRFCLQQPFSMLHFHPLHFGTLKTDSFSTLFFLPLNNPRIAAFRGGSVSGPLWLLRFYPALSLPFRQSPYLVFLSSFLVSFLHFFPFLSSLFFVFFLSFLFFFSFWLVFFLFFLILFFSVFLFFIFVFFFMFSFFSFVRSFLPSFLPSFFLCLPMFAPCASYYECRGAVPCQSSGS